MVVGHWRGNADRGHSASVPVQHTTDGDRDGRRRIATGARTPHGYHRGSFRPGRRAQIAIFGGPSFFQVEQDLVTDVSASSAYPYDTATFVGATTAEVSQSQVGFNAGVDVNMVFEARRRGCDCSLQPRVTAIPGGLGQEVTIRAGGLQIGGGVRFRFLATSQEKPPRPTRPLSETKGFLAIWIPLRLNVVFFSGSSLKPCAVAPLTVRFGLLPRDRRNRRISLARCPAVRAFARRPSAIRRRGAAHRATGGRGRRPPARRLPTRSPHIEHA